MAKQAPVSDNDDRNSIKWTNNEMENQVSLGLMSKGNGMGLGDSGNGEHPGLPAVHG